MHWKRRDLHWKVQMPNCPGRVMLFWKPCRKCRNLQPPRGTRREQDSFTDLFLGWEVYITALLALLFQRWWKLQGMFQQFTMQEHHTSMSWQNHAIVDVCCNWFKIRGVLEVKSCFQKDKCYENYTERGIRKQCHDNFVCLTQSFACIFIDKYLSCSFAQGQWL